MAWHHPLPLNGPWMPEQALAAPGGPGCGPSGPELWKLEGRTAGQGRWRRGLAYQRAGRESEARRGTGLGFGSKTPQEVTLPEAFPGLPAGNGSYSGCLEGFLRRQKLTSRVSS